MGLVDNSTYLIEKVVQEVKSQGLFDQFRKECISDFDTKPAYQNLKKRVETNVQNFLDQQEWRSDSNRNQMREKLRKHIAGSSFLETGVERIVEQVVNPKISTTFFPKIEEVVYQYLGIEKPQFDERQNFPNSSFLNNKTEVQFLPNDLEAVSPDSNKSSKSMNASTENLNDSNYDQLNESGEKIEEFESPAFEPLDGFGPEIVNKEESNDSHLSNISGLTSQDSVNSEKDLTINETPQIENQMDTTNNDSQLSQVSSNSRLSIVTKSETESQMDISEDTQMSSHMSASLQEKIDIVSKFDVKIEETSQDSVEMKDASKEREVEADLIKGEEIVVDPVVKSVEPEIEVELKEEIKEIVKIQPPAEIVVEEPVKKEEEEPLKKEEEPVKKEEEAPIKKEEEPIKKEEEPVKKEEEIKPEIKMEEEIKTSLDELNTKVEEEIKTVPDEEIKTKLDVDIIIGNSSTNDSIKSDETSKNKTIKDQSKSSPKTKSNDDKSRSRYSSDKSKDRHKSSTSSRHHSSSSNSRDDKKSRSGDRKRDDTPRKDDKSRRDDRKRSDDRTSSRDRHRSKSDSKSSRDKSRSDKRESSKYSSKGSSSRSRDTDRHRRSDPKDRKDKSTERPSSSNEVKSKERLVDDHYSLKDKVNEKRRSTDRDSNDGSNSGSNNFVNQETVNKTETTSKSNSTTSPSTSTSSTSNSSQDKTEAVLHSNVEENEVAVPMASQPVVFNSLVMGENTSLELVIGPDSKMNDFNILKKKPKTMKPEIKTDDEETDLCYFPEENPIFEENNLYLSYVNKMRAEQKVYEDKVYLLDCDEVHVKFFKDISQNVVEIELEDNKTNQEKEVAQTPKTNSLEIKDINKRQRKPNNRYSTNEFHVKIESDDEDDLMPKSEVLSKRKIEDDGINNNSNLMKRIKVDDNQEFEKANEVQVKIKSKENNLTNWVSLPPNNIEKDTERKVHQNNVKANQRYSSDDLYKPRPTVGIRRRRGDTAL